MGEAQAEVSPQRPDPRQNPLPKWASPAARCPALPLSQAVRVPSRRHWLVGLSLNFNGAIARLQHFVYDPEIASLLAASPRPRQAHLDADTRAWTLRDELPEVDPVGSHDRVYIGRGQGRGLSQDSAHP